MDRRTPVVTSPQAVALVLIGAVGVLWALVMEPHEGVFFWVVLVGGAGLLATGAIDYVRAASSSRKSEEPLDL